MKKLLENAIAQRNKTIKFMKGFLILTKLFAIMLIAISIIMTISLITNANNPQLAINMYITLFAATAAGYQYHIANDYVEDLEKRNRGDSYLLTSHK